MLFAFGSISSCPPYDLNVYAIQNVRYNILDHFTRLVIVVVIVVVVIFVVVVITAVIFAPVPFPVKTPSIMMA